MPRTGVQFIKNDEPSFIRQFKQKIGHKDEADIDTKRQIPNFDDDEEDDGRVEREDEKPLVVVLKEGDLTSEQAEQVEKEIEEGPAHLDRKITFKKPTKRSKDDEKGDDESSPATKTQKTKKDSSSKNKLKKKNTSLLSFGDDEEEDD